jgi:hypothetical protein
MLTLLYCQRSLVTWESPKTANSAVIISYTEFVTCMRA